MTNIRKEFHFRWIVAENHYICNGIIDANYLAIYCEQTMESAIPAKAWRSFPFRRAMYSSHKIPSNNSKNNVHNKEDLRWHNCTRYKCQTRSCPRLPACPQR